MKLYRKQFKDGQTSSAEAFVERTPRKRNGDFAENDRKKDHEKNKAMCNIIITYMYLYTSTVFIYSKILVSSHKAVTGQLTAQGRVIGMNRERPMSATVGAMVSGPTYLSIKPSTPVAPSAICSTDDANRLPFICKRIHVRLCFQLNERIMIRLPLEGRGARGTRRPSRPSCCYQNYCCHCEDYCY